MSEIHLQLQSQNSNYEPGQILSGQAHWVLDTPATAIEISLIWSTSGKGTTDQGKAFTQRVEHPPQQGQQPFSFTLPAGPFSFSGRLITLSWAVEAIILPGKTKTQYEFVLAPGRMEITLP